MKITILTYGSRGDVQPFIPLSLGLMARGHSVKLAAPSRFRSLIGEHHIQFVPLSGDPEDLSRRLNNAGHNFIKMIRDLMHHAVEVGADVLRQTEDACSDADLIIHTFMHAVGGHTLARQKNIPDVHVQLFPMFTPTGDYPNVTLPDLQLAPLNRLSHILAQKVTIWSSRIGFQQVRRRSALPKQKLYSPFETDPSRPRTPILCAWSPSVVPASSDWSSNVHITGYYFSDSDDACQPPDQLLEFLNDGSPPICVSFGSMLNRDAERIDGIVQQTLRETSNRGIILSGWRPIRSNPSTKDILYLDAAPFQWLLPRCKMIIHHGGAGTTAAGLRAGIPNIVIPFAADQPFWGKRVYAVGAGPRPVLLNDLSVEKLTQAIVYAEHETVCQGARAVRQRLRNEDGVNISIKIMEHYSNKIFTGNI
jgi:sterol 3beta-glucosyltransferase